MSWGSIASAVVNAGSAYYQSTLQDDSGGGGDFSGLLEHPEYYEDPDYRETQDYLKGYGMNLLKGNIPDYYKAIGETGSEEFENMLSLTNRDITQSTSEALAKGGRSRGGQLAASTAKAIGDSSVTARYKDYARSLVGKAGLLNTGVGITEGVRNTGQKEGSLVNDFNWKDYDASFDEYELMYEMQRDADEDSGSFLGNILGIGKDFLGSDTGKGILGKIGGLFGKKTSASDYSYGSAEAGYDTSNWR